MIAERGTGNERNTNPNPQSALQPVARHVDTLPRAGQIPKSTARGLLADETAPTTSNRFCGHWPPATAARSGFVRSRVCNAPLRAALRPGHTFLYQPIVIPSTKF
jgi:hypothetical protein